MASFAPNFSIGPSDGGAARISRRIHHELDLFGHGGIVGKPSFRFEICVIGIWKGKYDVEMLGEGQVIQEGKDPCDMDPPEESFHQMKAIVAKA